MRELINKSCGFHLFFVSDHVSAFQCPKQSSGTPGNVLTAEHQLEKLFFQIPGGSEKMQIHLFCMLFVSNSCFALSGLSTRGGVTCPNVPEGPG